MKIEVDINDALYERIFNHAEDNNENVNDYVSKLINDGFMVDLYGSAPFAKEREEREKSEKGKIVVIDNGHGTKPTEARKVKKGINVINKDENNGKETKSEI